MNRSLHYLVGPESVIAIAALLVYLFCAKHASGDGEDVRLLERLIVILPPILVAAVFLTILAPGAANWWWLGRALAAAFIGVGIIAARIIEGFGSGAKGQDAAFIFAMILAGLVASLGAAITGAIILAQERPGFAEWFRARPATGSLLTLFAAAPIGIVLFFAVTIGGALLLQLWVAIRR